MEITTQFRRFKLSKDFISNYKGKQPKWGPLGYVTYKSRYARAKDEGGSEEFWETLIRVVEGIFNIQKKHCSSLGLEWNNAKSQKTAQEMYTAMWEFKFLPPGRGLWMAGTPYVEERTGMGLFNCSMVSTEDIDRLGARPFEFIMDGLMLGVGMGFDTKGEGKLVIQEPSETDSTFVIADSREGWVESTGVLIQSYFTGGKLPRFDYGAIRKEGAILKGFGGVSSGPQPLIDLHENLVELFNTRLGDAITSTDIVDIENFISKCVIAGNIRRSAAIALGRHDDEAFMELKHDQEKLKSHRYGSNNSIFAEIGMDYEECAENTIKQGEPGYVWLENLRNFGRFKDGPNDDDQLVVGVNPCFSGDTLVECLIDGIEYTKPISECIAVPGLELKNKYGEYKSSRVWYSGEKDTIELTMYRYGKITCTPNHVFVTSDSEEVEAKDLLGKRLLIPFKEAPENFDLEFVKLGFIQGDGNLTRLASAHRHRGFEVNFSQAKDKDILDLFGYSTSARTVYTTEFFDRCIELGFSHETLPSRSLPKSFKTWSILQKRSFLRGLYSANGSVITKHRIALKTSCVKLAEEVAEVLSSLGISSYTTTNKKKNVKFKNGTYECKESYDINISKRLDVVKFYETIGFVNKYKTDSLNKLIARKSPMVTHIAQSKKQEVYDFEIGCPEHLGVVGGVVVHNCSEQQLESFEMCCLVETFPVNHDSFEDFLHTIKLAYLYGKTITLVNTHWPETNGIMLKNRRIGLSQSGIQQARTKFGTRELLEWSDEGYNYIKELDAKYSDWLCVPRSKRVTSVKPSGTVSLLPGVTPGIHYPEAEFYIRRIRFEKGSPLLPPLREAGFEIEQDYYNENSMVVAFPVQEVLFERTKYEVTLWEQMEFASKYQYFWSDNAVSITVTFREEEAQDIKHALALYEDKLKVVSFLPLGTHGYKQAPYEAITKEKYNKMKKGLKRPNFKNISTMAIGEKYCDGDKCEV